MLVGVVLSILLFVPRAAKLKAEELVVAPEGVVRERTPEDTPDPLIVIYDLEGELFFGAAPELDRYLDSLSERIQRDKLQFAILRLKRVRHPDVVCIERLEHFVREQQERGVTVLLAGVRPDTADVLHNVGFGQWFPEEQLFPQEDELYSATLKAVRYARTRADEASDSEKLYYLV